MTPASKLASRLSNSDPISSSSAHRMVWLTWKTSCSTSTPSARGTRKWTIANAHHAATTSQWGSTRSCPATWWEFWEWIKMCRVLLPTDRLERALSLFPYGKARCPCRRWGRGQCWCVSGDGEKIGGGKRKIHQCVILFVRCGGGVKYCCSSIEPFTPLSCRAFLFSVSHNNFAVTATVDTAVVATVFSYCIAAAQPIYIYIWNTPYEVTLRLNKSILSQASLSSTD